MVRWLKRWVPAPESRTCRCGEPLDRRVVGAAERWGGEPVSSLWRWHCHRCGDVRD